MVLLNLLPTWNGKIPWGSETAGSEFRVRLAVTIARDMESLKTLLKALAEDGAQLTREQASDVLRQVLAGGVPEVGEGLARLTRRTPALRLGREAGVLQQLVHLDAQ